MLYDGGSIDQVLLKSLTLYTSAESDPGGRVLSEVEKESFIALSEKGNVLVSVLKNCPLEFREGHGSWSLAYKRWGTVRIECLGAPQGPT